MLILQLICWVIWLLIMFILFRADCQEKNVRVKEVRLCLGEAAEAEKLLRYTLTRLRPYDRLVLTVKSHPDSWHDLRLILTSFQRKNPSLLIQFSD